MNIKIIIALCLLQMSLTLYGDPEDWDNSETEISQSLEEAGPARLSEIWDMLNAEDPGLQDSLDPHIQASSEKATTVLRWLVEHPEKHADIKSLTLVAPIVSLSELSNHWAKQNADIGFQGITSFLLYHMLAFNFPNFATSSNHLLRQLKKQRFPFPVFVSCLKDDPLASADSIANLVGALRKNNRVFLCVIDPAEHQEPISHSSLSSSLAFQSAKHAFFAQQQFPHHFEFVLTGKTILDRTSNNL